VRRAELDVVGAGEAAGDRALRELLALQSSDWPFMVSRGLAEPYGRERVAGHGAALAAALAEPGGGQADGSVRALAPRLVRGALLAP
jgi:1,4-alpha-glucan branching enzyme